MLTNSFHAGEEKLCNGDGIHGGGGGGINLSQRSSSYGEVAAGGVGLGSAAGDKSGKNKTIFSKGNFTRLFKPWKWKRRKKSERFEKASKSKYYLLVTKKVAFPIKIQQSPEKNPTESPDFLIDFPPF